MIKQLRNCEKKNNDNTKKKQKKNRERGQQHVQVLNKSSRIVRMHAI